METATAGDRMLAGRLNSLVTKKHCKHLISKYCAGLNHLPELSQEGISLLVWTDRVLHLWQHQNIVVYQILSCDNNLSSSDRL